MTAERGSLDAGAESVGGTTTEFAQIETGLPAHSGSVMDADVGAESTPAESALTESAPTATVLSVCSEEKAAIIRQIQAFWFKKGWGKVDCESWIFGVLGFRNSLSELEPDQLRQLARAAKVPGFGAEVAQQTHLPEPIPTPKGKRLPIVPWVLAVGDRFSAYAAPQLLVESVVYATPSTVRLKGEGAAGTDGNAYQHLVYCIPDESSWVEALRLRDEFDRTLKLYGETLLSLGNYRSKLAEAGGSSVLSPLTPTVVKNWHSPQQYLPFSDQWKVPTSQRCEILRHTAAMLQTADAPGLQNQYNFWLCPSDGDWERLKATQAAAPRAAEALRQFLCRQLGTYKEAAADGRYSRLFPADAAARNSSIDAGVSGVAEPLRESALGRAGEVVCRPIESPPPVPVPAQKDSVAADADAGGGNAPTEFASARTESGSVVAEERTASSILTKSSLPVFAPGEEVGFHGCPACSFGIFLGWTADGFASVRHHSSGFVSELYPQALFLWSGSEQEKLLKKLRDFWTERSWGETQQEEWVRAVLGYSGPLAQLNSFQIGLLLKNLNLEGGGAPLTEPAPPPPIAGAAKDSVADVGGAPLTESAPPSPLVPVGKNSVADASTGAPPSAAVSAHLDSAVIGAGCAPTTESATPSALVPAHSDSVANVGIGALGVSSTEFDAPDPETLDPEGLAEKLIRAFGGPVSSRFREALREFCAEAWGVRKADFSPDLRFFVNAQAATYQGERNNLCGDLQLSPVRVARGKALTRLPESLLSLKLSQSTVFLDSGAFSEVRTERVPPQRALDRQLLVLSAFSSQPQGVWLVSYDRLIDEKLLEGERVKQRWSAPEAESAVKETVAAAHFLAGQRERVPHTLVFACQGVDAPQYFRCASQILERCQAEDVLGLGGWCILGRQKKMLPVFRSAMELVVPTASEVVKHVHIFGVSWHRRAQGISPPLPWLLRLCDKYGLELSSDSGAPILNALRKGDGWKQAEAYFPHWRKNLAWTKACLATLRESLLYQEGAPLVIDFARKSACARSAEPSTPSMTLPAGEDSVAEVGGASTGAPPAEPSTTSMTPLAGEDSVAEAGGATGWVETYRPAGTANGGNEYFRFVWFQSRQRQVLHIPGGNRFSPIAEKRAAVVESLIAVGTSPAKIGEVVKSWRRGSSRAKSSARGKAAV